MDNGSHPIGVLAARVLAFALNPFLQFLLRDSQLYWPYLLTTAAGAVIGYCALHGARRENLLEFRRRFLSQRLWTHPSATADYAYYVVNGLLWPLLVAPFVITGGAIAGGVDRALVLWLGPAGAPHLALALLRTLYTLLFFLVFDFARFLAHDLLHDVPVLWQFHKLHHSAEVLTPLTNYRSHPVEQVVMAVVPNLATGVVSGVFWYGSGNAIGFYTFLGVNVAFAAFNTIANLRHFPVWISFGPVLDRWLISPAHHQLHHSCAARHFGCNRGFALAVWDRMFGTLFVPGVEEELTFGLGDGTDGAWHDVGRMYGWPVRYALALYGLGRAPAAVSGAEPR